LPVAGLTSLAIADALSPGNEDSLAGVSERRELERSASEDSVAEAQRPAHDGRGSSADNATDGLVVLFVERRQFDDKLLAVIRSR
jgi:hypothetical protein